MQILESEKNESKLRKLKYLIFYIAAADKMMTWEE